MAAVQEPGLASQKSQAAKPQPGAGPPLATASPAESAAAEREKEEEEEKEKPAPELSAGAATALQRTGVPLRGAALQAAVGGVKISKKKTKQRRV